MTKTELTKQIEESIIAWHPAISSGIAINTIRAEHTALEVPVVCGTNKGGLVDAVRVSEYIGYKQDQHICALSKWQNDGMRIKFDCPRGKDTEGKLELLCSEKSCRYNILSKVGQDKILITAFEIKVTKRDFKSKNGHNFIGNLNYYVVPRDIYKEIEPLVPEEIGILVFSRGRIRTQKKAVFKEITDEDQKWLILSVLKRIRKIEYKQS